MVHVLTEDSLAILVVFLGEENVGMPHFVDVTKGRDFLAPLQEGELEKAEVVFLSRFASFGAPLVFVLELLLDATQIELVNLADRPFGGMAFAKPTDQHSGTHNSTFVERTGLDKRYAHLNPHFPILLLFNTLVKECASSYDSLHSWFLKT